jgi:aminopeptidase-like protein
MNRQELDNLLAELYPICRSITGDGVRRTLAILKRRVPLEIVEVPSATTVFDWTVPDEWNIREAWIEDPQGRRVVDLDDHSLHVLNYSVPVDRTMTLAELGPHLHSLPESPDLIPYRTSYYNRTWGFCLAHRTLEALAEGEYRVRIDSTLEPGHLTYGELHLPGASEEEILFSTHVCHPSLANDNLSGIAVCLALAERLAAMENRRWSYRFLFIPGTIGSITWLARNEGAAARIRGGLVAANLGDTGRFHYKRSRQGDSWIDRSVVRALERRDEAFEVEDFIPFGYDERQYCSPGFDLPVGSLTRTPYGRYPEYHTSADDLDFVQLGSIEESVEVYHDIVRSLEESEIYRNLSPRCEPQLGKRGLYGSLGGSLEGRDGQLAILWVLNQSDGDHSLADIADRSGMPLETLREAAGRLFEAGLLERI